MRSAREAENRIAGKEFDVCIIGGGATGAGCALDSQLRGLRTVLVEGNDFASGTSSTSTKLIHGGVRYLEQAVKEFDLAEYRVVRRALHERIRMLHNAPYLSRPLEFIVPCFDWPTTVYMGLGLKMYDWIAGESRLYRSRYLGKTSTETYMPRLKHDKLVGSVVYADGQFDDGRYNLALVKSMVEAGGEALNHARIVTFEKDAQGKLLAVEAVNQLTGQHFFIRAKAFVNATGPWADTLRQMANPEAHPRMRVSKGVHILLPLELYQSNYALLIPKTEDGRVLFAVPWFDRLLVGTTETECSVGDEMCVRKEEVDYILRHINHYLKAPILPEQILSGTAGMRPLVSAAGNRATSKLARDHEVELDTKSGLLSIMGGKWTTYRAMAEDAINGVQKNLGQTVTAAKTSQYLLAGSEQYTVDYWKALVQRYSVSEPTAHHLVQKFGARARNLLELVLENPDLAKPIVPGYSPLRAEIVYAAREEMASTVEDVLRRRIGLELLSWRAAREAAAATAGLLAQELCWDTDFERNQLKTYQDKVTRMLQLAGLPDEQPANQLAPTKIIERGVRSV